MSLPVVCGALATCLAGVAVADDASTAQPEAFRVVSSSVEVGDVISGRVGVATFEFRNDADTDVRILRAAPS
jgi:hypothetical protein